MGGVSALLLATGFEPVIVRLHPWYTRPDADQLTDGVARCQRWMLDVRQGLEPDAGLAA